MDPSIRIHGMQDSAHVAELMDQCGPVVIPSTCFEGLPLVLAEAIARGRPIIASDIGGRVARVLVKNGQGVEYGQSLVIIEPL